MQSKPKEIKPRDGVWISNGLAADFRFIRQHFNSSHVRVLTAAGEAWALENELAWDIKPQPKET
jgi:hypothetical protein